MRSALLLLSLGLGACDGAVQVSASGFGAFEPAVTVIDESVAVAWYDNRHGEAEIYLRLLDAQRALLGGELRVTTNPAASYEVALATLDTALAVAWYDRNAAGELSVQVGAWTAQGDRLWQRSLSNPLRNGRIPVLESLGDSLFVAWVEEDRATDRQQPGATAAAPSETVPDATVFGAWLDTAGNFLQVPFVIADASLTTWNLNTATLADGRVALVFDAEHETRSSELYLALIDGAGSSTRHLSADDGFASKYPDIALNDDTTALTWFDNREGNDEVYLAVADLAALITDEPLAPGLEQAATRITHTNGYSIGAYLAWNGNRLGLAWNDDEGGQHEIWFQDFDRRGQPLAPPQRLTDTPEQSMIPAIAAFEAGFVLAWGEVVLTDGHGSSRAEIMLRFLE